MKRAWFLPSPVLIMWALIVTWMALHTLWVWSI